MADTPLVVLIGGPNGAGKTTAAPRLLRGALAVTEYVNADPIAMGLSFFRPEDAALTAGRVMLLRIQALADARESFAFETTLASRSFVPWLQRLRTTGYGVHLVFLALQSADLAVARVAQRVADGGHSVPEATVRRRFATGLRNFFTLYRPIADSWQLFDNTDSNGPQPVARGARDSVDQVQDQTMWNKLLDLQR